MEIIPNCYNCGRKHGGRYVRKNSDVGVICKQCRDKETKKALARCAKCNKFIYKKEEAKGVNPEMSCGEYFFAIWCLECCEKYEYWTTLKYIETPREKEHRIRQEILKNYKCAGCQQSFNEIDLLTENYKIEKLIKDYQEGADIIKAVRHKWHEKQQKKN